MKFYRCLKDKIPATDLGNKITAEVIYFFLKQKKIFFKGPQLSLTEMGDEVMENILLFNNLTEGIFRDKSFPLKSS